jgi:hypothetical protein
MQTNPLTSKEPKALPENHAPRLKALETILTSMPEKLK